MLTTQRDDIKVTSNLDGQKIGMKFDENSLAHIMSVLTDLYSDPALAVIREYSTNALDSHRAAGQTRPIEVVLPSALSPYFKVKDFGVGLSVDDITNIYSKYGASTKRETNEQVGMLGLGCKSALTYTNSFNVVAVKDGVKIHVCISRIEDGTGTMEVVDTSSTNQPNGVEIVIPTKDAASFIRKANTFFQYWEAGSVLVNDKPVESVLSNEIAPGLFMVPGNDEDRIVMGNVAYPVNESLYRQGGYYKNFHVVAVVPIGDINFTPSREALQYTAKTKATVERVTKNFAAALDGSVRKDINDSPDHSEATARYIKWNNMLGYGMPKAIKYRGSDLKTQWVGCRMHFYVNRSRAAVYGTNNFNLGDIKSNTALVVGYAGAATLSARNKQKVRTYLTDNDLDNFKTLIFCDAHPDPVWLGNVKTIEWADIAATSLGDGKRSARVKVENFSVWTKRVNYSYFMDSPLDPKDEIIFIGPREGHTSNSINQLQAEFPSAKIVSLAANRWDKFMRDYPQAQHARTVVQALVAKAFGDLTKNDKILHNVDHYAKRMAAALDATKIDDPAVKNMIAVANMNAATPTKIRWDKVRNLAINMAICVPEIEEIESENVMLNYPLVDQYNVRSSTDDIILYMNAKYASLNA